MDFDNKEEEDQCLRLLRRFRPQKHQQYIEKKKKRPPDFEDGDLDKTDDATTTTTSLPTEEQPATKFSTKLDSYDSYVSSLGGSSRQLDSEKPDADQHEDQPNPISIQSNSNPIQIQSKFNPIQIQSNPIQSNLIQSTDANDYDCFNAESVLQTKLMA